MSKGRKRVIDIDLVIEADHAKNVIQGFQAMLKERRLPAATITVGPAASEETKAYYKLKISWENARAVKSIA